MGARETVKLQKKKYKRPGVISKAEREFVTAIVMDQPQEITPAQERALATVLRRPRDTVKRIIEEARDSFVESAGRYVDIHRQVTEAGLRDGTPKGLEVAAKGAQWAIEHISSEGVRIIDKVVAESTGTKIMIGVRLGGMVEPEVIGVKVG